MEKCASHLDMEDAVLKQKKICLGKNNASVNNPTASKASRKVANLTERKNLHKILAVWPLELFW